MISHQCQDCGGSLALEAGDPAVEPCPCGGHAYALPGRVIQLGAQVAVVWLDQVLEPRWPATTAGRLEAEAFILNRRS